MKINPKFEDMNGKYYQNSIECFRLKLSIPREKVTEMKITHKCRGGTVSLAVAYSYLGLFNFISSIQHALLFERCWLM